MLMFQMYPNALVIYREYVQNALDAIIEALDKGILQNLKDGLVTINISSKDITIHDNGCGISVKTAESTLLDVSSSTKNGRAGMFGIGRLVGAGFCHELIFKTSFKGEAQATVVHFDVDKISEYLNDKEFTDSASVVIDKTTTVNYIEESVDAHYFEVLLKNVKTESDSKLLSKADVVAYLNEVAPVEYQSQFNNVLIYGSSKDNQEFYNRHIALERVQIIVNNTRLQKQYGLKVVGTGDDIQKLEYFGLNSSKFGELGWGWFGLTKYSAQIPSSDTLSGIRLRIHNIEIGDAHLLSGKPFWQEDRGNYYFYGEIHITNPNILPNSARDGLAPTAEKTELESVLIEYFAKLKKLYSKASEARSAIKKVHEGIEEIKAKGLTAKAKDLINNKGKDKFDKLYRNEPFKPILTMLSFFKPEMDNALQEYKDIIAPPPEPPVTDLPQPPVVNDPEYPVTGSPQPPVVNDPEYPVTDSPQPPVVPCPPPTISTDILSPLIGKLEESEIWLIRRIFHVLTEYCPTNERDIKLIESLKKLVIKDLINQ